VRILRKGGVRLAAAGTESGEVPTEGVYEIEAVTQGSDGFERIHEAQQNEQQFALAFIDIRMPPGWDGIETTERIWQVDPNVSSMARLVSAATFRNESISAVVPAAPSSKPTSAPIPAETGSVLGGSSGLSALVCDI